jgi:hypothetical protein
VSFVRVLGEDTDEETYEPKDGEETPVVSEDDSVLPAGKTFVQKDGPSTVIQFLSESDVQEASQSEVESDVFPQPAEDDFEDTIPHRSPVSAAPVPPRAKPEWWTPVWDQLSGTVSSRGWGVEQPLCRLQFREECNLPPGSLGSSRSAI